MEAPSLQQKAALAASEAAQAAQIAQEAALLATLESIGHVKDFLAKSNGNRFEADRLKSAFIKRYGFDRWSTLCGQSR
jgi:hypothetical protein